MHIFDAWPALLKLLLHPLIVYILLSWVGGFDGIWVYTAVLLAGLSPAVNTLAFAREYGVGLRSAATSLFIGTVAASISLLLILSLIFSGLLPVAIFR